MRAWREASGPRGGRSYFVVESKSFEILVEELGGKLKGCIWERCKGISSWIRFGEASLRCLLDRVETCCRESNNRGWAIGWEKGNMKYKLERRLNEFSLIFPEGKGQSLGVFLAPKGPEDLTREKGGSKVQWREKGVELKSYADAVKISPRRVGHRLEVGKERCEKGLISGVSARIQALKKSGKGGWAPSSFCVEREFPSSVQIVVGSGCYSLQLWWELPPWFTQVVSAGSLSGEGGSRGGEEDGGSQREKFLLFSVMISNAVAMEGRVGLGDGRVKGTSGLLVVGWLYFGPNSGPTIIIGVFQALPLKEERAKALLMEKGAGFGLDGLAAVAGEALTGEGPLASRPRAISTSLEVEAIGVADPLDPGEVPSALVLGLK
ncbi:hypothetical protein AAG906_031275 [Vitis piasezkii]